MKHKNLNLLLTLANTILIYNDKERWKHYYDIAFKKRIKLFENNQFIDNEYLINNSLEGMKMMLSIPRMREAYKIIDHVDWLKEHAKRLKEILIKKYK